MGQCNETPSVAASSSPDDEFGEGCIGGLGNTPLDNTISSCQVKKTGGRAKAKKRMRHLENCWVDMLKAQ